MFCEKCGIKNEDNAKFCLICGAGLKRNDKNDGRGISNEKQIIEAQTEQASASKDEELKRFFKKKKDDFKFAVKMDKCINDRERDEVLKAEGFTIKSTDINPAEQKMQMKEAVPNYLAQSILVTIFCCLPIGIPAIVFSAQANDHKKRGNYLEAMESADKAKTWCIVALCAGLLAVIIRGCMEVL